MASGIEIKIPREDILVMYKKNNLKMGIRY